MTFAQPQWFWLALLVLPLALARVLGRGRGARALDAWVPERLREGLVQRNSPTLGWVAFTLQLLGLLLLIGALARPLYGEEEVETETEGRNIILALDTSRSMLAEDVEPDRLARAKLACVDLLTDLFGERIGVIAFAGRAFLQAPLTADHDAVLETIRQLDTYTIARGGTNLAEAIKIAAETFAKSGASSNGLILFSDGDELEGEALEAAREAREAGITIITVGVGTEFGSIIPDPEAARRGGEPYITDNQGNVVKSRLGTETLRALAKAAGGFYFTLGSGDLPIAQIRGVLDNLETLTQEGDSRVVPIERYRWPLSFGLLLLLLGQLLKQLPLRWLAARTSPLRLSTASALLPFTLSPLLFLGLPSETRADQAVEAYNTSDYEAALEGYGKRLGEGWRGFQRPRLQLGRGAAAYQLGDLETASEAFGEALKAEDKAIQTDAHYNLGNTLARLGKAAEGDLESQHEIWENALEHYRSAIDLRGDHPDAVHNEQVVQKLLDEVKEEQQKQEEEQKKEEQEKKEQEEGEEKENEGEEQQDPKEQEPEDGEGEEEEKSEEEKEEEGDNPEESQEQSEGGEENEEQKGEGEESEEQPEDGGENSEEKQDEGGGEQKQTEGSEGEAAPEGELEAADGGEEQEEGSDQEPQEAQGDQEADQQAHKETGLTPARARALLRAFADEDNRIRPKQPRPKNERYKNW